MAADRIASQGRSKYIDTSMSHSQFYIFHIQRRSRGELALGKLLAVCYWRGLKLSGRYLVYDLRVSLDVIGHYHYCERTMYCT